MSEENSSIRVGEINDVILVRVEGRATHLNSHSLKKYLVQCLDENRRLFQMDLSNCVYMDSTFLGMLAGLGSKMKERALPSIKLLNATTRVREMLEGLGIDHLFEWVQETVSDQSLDPLQQENISTEIKSRQMLEAHQNLISLSRANEDKFRDVVVLLREKVKK